MICPRCSVAEISPETNRCVLCGYAASPATSVAVQEGPAVSAEPGVEARIEAAARDELGSLFHIERALDTGFMSTYVAREVETERKVVLRVLPRQPVRDAGLEDKLQRDLATTASLDHPHVVPVHRYGATSRYLWYSGKYIAGQSLAELLRASGPLSLHHLLRIVEQVASALQYAHRRGVVHADVRPAHVRVDPDGWSLLTGFVVGRALDRLPLTTLGGRPLRRPEYLAPEERYSRQPGPAADQFSLAVLVYECLTGSLPFDGMGPDDVIPPAIASPRGDMPEHVREGLRRALSQRPGERFQSVLEFVGVLELDPTPRASSFQAPLPRSALQGAPPPPAAPPPNPRALPAPRRRTPTPGPKPDTAPAREATATPVLLVEQGSSWRSAIKWAAVVGGIIAAGVFGPSTLERLRENRAAGVPAAPRAATTLARDSVPEAVPPPMDLVDSTAAGLQVIPPAIATNTPQPAAPQPTPATTARPPVSRPAPPVTPNPAPTPTPAPGRLFVNATPWGQLFIDGQLVGNTPQANLVVSAGPHRVRVVREGFQAFERVIQLAPGQELRLTDIVLTAVTP